MSLVLFVRNFRVLDPVSYFGQSLYYLEDGYFDGTIWTIIRRIYVGNLMVAIEVISWQQLFLSLEQTPACVICCSKPALAHPHKQGRYLKCCSKACKLELQCPHPGCTRDRRPHKKTGELLPACSLKHEKALGRLQFHAVGCQRNHAFCGNCGGRNVSISCPDCGIEWNEAETPDTGVQRPACPQCNAHAQLLMGERCLDCGAINVEHGLRPHKCLFCKDHFANQS